MEIKLFDSVLNFRTILMYHEDRDGWRAQIVQGANIVGPNLFNKLVHASRADDQWVQDTKIRSENYLLRSDAKE